ncbi:MAG: glutaredoxin family protein [Methanobrevibacter sp.]|uniref:glutaredoxin family protein n=1 Tax=Methanobrevibacter sp. TaxID=66852 RepID=UPI0026DF0A77|nr:glutaredoxin family protein [Methanobrevibacter sp.]MDO5848467.1 glutaredoxin family protein [Methanobrevibacter sp.]
MNYESKDSDITHVAGNNAEMSEIEWKHVDGENHGNIKLFALSTCGWCKKTRMYLEENEVAYDYVYVDLTTGAQRDIVMREFEEYNPDMSFPTIVINGSEVIIGYEPDEMAKELNI